VLNVAARHPEAIRTLILVDTSGLEALLPDTPEASALSAETQQLVDRLAADLAKGDREAALRAYVEAFAGPGRKSCLTTLQPRSVPKSGQAFHARLSANSNSRYCH
jgi:pimeloyl-ACP methyl ester carboxylesterase